MKRVTILVKEIADETDSDGDLAITPFDSYPTIYIQPQWVVAVEDEPLPETPGERFWGACDRLAQPQWWFTQLHPSVHFSEIAYVPATDAPLLGAAGHIAAFEAGDAGLGRLPEPEVPASRATGASR